MIATARTERRERSGLADLDDLLGGVVGVVALVDEQLGAVLRGLALGLGRCRRGRCAASTPCSLMNSAHSTSCLDHLVLGHDGDVAAP